MPHLRAQKDDKRAGLLKIENKQKDKKQIQPVQETPTLAPDLSIDADLEDSFGNESRFGQTILPLHQLIKTPNIKTGSDVDEIKEIRDNQEIYEAILKVPRSLKK